MTRAKSDSQQPFVVVEACLALLHPGTPQKWHLLDPNLTDGCDILPHCRPSFKLLCNGEP